MNFKAKGKTKRYRTRPMCKRCETRPARWIYGTLDERMSMRQGWEKREDLVFLCGRCRYRMGGNVAKAATHKLPSYPPVKHKMLVSMTEADGAWLKQYAQDYGISMSEAIRRALDLFFKDNPITEDDHAKKNGMDKPKKHEDFDEWYDGSVEGN